MAAKIIAFGQIAEITGKELELNVGDTDSLSLLLQENYPALVHKKYIIAVNKKIQTHNAIIDVNDVVALMPPFSGG